MVGAGPVLAAEVGPVDYPDSYVSPARFVRERRTAYRDPEEPDNPAKLEWFCFTCTFRPWLDTGEVTRARVTIRDAATGTLIGRVAATLSGDRWITARRLRPGEVARVEAGGVRDAYGNFNGAPSNPVGG